MRTLALVSDAFGGHGGIAQYNRDLLQALCEDPAFAEVVVLPRLMYHGRDPRPDKLTHDLRGIGGRVKYARALLRICASKSPFDLVLCCHINLLPLAWLAAKIKRAPLMLVIFGIDAWQPTNSRLTNTLIAHVDGCITISRHTRRMFLRWSKLPAEKVWLLPNAVHLPRYGVGPKNGGLIGRHDLGSRRVVMTFGRLAHAERYKGFDEVLEALPKMLEIDPNLVYLIVGDGNDRPRLERKVQELHLAHAVRFAGAIAEEEKADYFRLADAYVMPSRGEGFGFVFLEAMACGVPAVASTLDGSRDAAADGALAATVDPGDTAALINATFTALQQPKRVPETLRRFDYRHFSAHARRVVRRVIENGMGAAAR